MINDAKGDCPIYRLQFYILTTSLDYSKTIML